jgi:SNF2 family DNA or RNA helicase
VNKSTFILDLFKQLQTNFNPQDIQSLHYLYEAAMQKSKNPNIGISWEGLTMPFADEPEILILHLYDQTSQSEYVIVLASRPLLIDNVVSRQSVSLTTKENLRREVYISLVARGGTYTHNFNVALLYQKTMILLGLASQPLKFIEGLNLPKNPLQNVIKLKAQMEAALVENEVLHDPVVALLVCIPKGVDANPNLEKNRVELRPFDWPVYTSPQVQINTDPNAVTNGYDRNYYTRNLKMNGLIDTQILLKSGRVIAHPDPSILAQLKIKPSSQSALMPTLKHLARSALGNEAIYLEDNEVAKLQTMAHCFASSIPLYLTEGYDANKTRNYWLVESLAWTNPETPAPVTLDLRPAKSNLNDAKKEFADIFQHVGIADLGMKRKNADPLPLITNQLLFEPDSRTLTVHGWHKTIQNLDYDIGVKLLSGHEQLCDSQCLTGKVLMGRSAFECVGHERIQNIIELLTKKYASVFSGKSIQSNNVTPIETTIDASESSFKFFIRLKAAEPHAKTGDSEDYYITNFVDPWRMHLQAVEGGLSSFLHDHEKDELAGRKKSTRAENLKLIRHSGAYLCILHSTLEWIYQPEKLRPKRKLFDQALLTKIELLLRGKDFRNECENKFSSRFSTKLEKYILELVTSLIVEFDSSASTHLFWNGKTLVARGLAHTQGKIVYFWLQELLFETKGDLFKSSKNKYFPSVQFMPPYDSKSINSLKRVLALFDTRESIQDSELRASYVTDANPESPRFSWRAWPRISTQFTEFNLLLKGRPIEALAASDFRCEFAVSNNASGLTAANKAINWFDLNPQYFLNGKPIGLLAAQTLTRQGIVEHEGQYYMINIKKLPSQKALELFWARLAGNSSGAGLGGKSSGRNKNQPISRHHILELLALRKMGIPFQGPPEWLKVCEYFDALAEPHQQIKLAGPLTGILKPYQKLGVQWLWDLYHLKIGGILADDMGLGKTIQALAFVDHLRVKKKSHRSLVVVPVSLVYNWISETQKFTPNLKTMVYDPAKDVPEDIDLLICTYGLLALHKDKLAAKPFDLAFFDEAQNLKNRDTDRFTGAEALKADVKIMLTGTPLENHLGNLYALISIVAPGVLGSFSDFSREYIKTDSIDADSLEFLRAQLKPLILRRTKDQLLKELPAKSEMQLKIEFSPKQKELYKKTALAFSDKITEIIAKDGETKSQLHMLAALLRLRQICSDPSALPGTTFKEIPPKIELLFEKLEEAIDEGHSVILFTQFLHTYDRILKIAQDRKIRMYSLCGSDSGSSRVKTLSAFNDSPEPSVLLMTLKTGGVGLNLTKASYVFHLEPWWNPAVENQATDRVHRIGQTKAISVYRLIMRESVEEKVEILKARKGALFSKMFGEDYFSKESIEGSEQNGRPQTSALSQKDFEVLLS